MKFIVGILNYLKSKFRLLLILTSLVLGLVLVQYIGRYESFVWKYGIGLGFSIPLALIWYQLERKLSQNLASDHQRSAIWILLFLLLISLGLVHVIQKELSYQYHIAMCDCNKEDTTQDRVGAICEDGEISYSVGRGTCSEHNGVKKWQCECN